MNKNQLVFEDTRTRMNSNQQLALKTARLCKNTRVYGEHFYSDKCSVYEKRKVEICETLTLIAAKKYVSKDRKTAVLNFANPIEAGGGILRGAEAQEEYLCRASNLYASLISANAEEFYCKHKKIIAKNQYNSMFLASDALIYSPEVTVFKEDVGYVPETSCAATQEYTEDWFAIDVITSAAPFFSGLGYILPDGDLQRIFEHRIRNVFEAAIENNIQSIILGAWGCGAFHNPSSVVAEAFTSVLSENRYRNAFMDVVFAIKRTGSACENLQAFQSIQL